MKMCRRFIFVAVLAALGTAGLAPPVRADLWLSYQEDSGPVTTVNLAAGAPTSFPGLIGSTSFNTANFAVVLQTGQAYQGILPKNTQLLGSTTNIANTGSTGTHSLTLTLYATGYTVPTIPPDAVLASSLGGSVAVGHADNALVFQSWVNNGAPGSLTGPTTGVQSADITNLGGYNTGSAKTLVTVLGSPFQLVERMTFTLGEGANLNYSSSTTLTTVPEPMSMFMVMSGIPVVGLYLVRRRRARVSPPVTA